jgi:MiaB/RimO family radical SAM methylthiotransferase
MVRRWEALSDRIPKLVVTGCLVPLRIARFSGPAKERTSFVRIGEQSRIVELLGGAGSSEEPHLRPAPPDLPASEEVVIAQGCTSHCAYCFSRLARGPLTSRPLEDVARRAQDAIERGAVEVRLSSLDTSCWGVDLEEENRLPELLKAVTDLRGSFRVRVGMASPQTLGPISERLFAAMANPHVFRFLHLPVQSGSDRVLESMRRGYTVADVRRLVAAARAALPDLMLATDIIVGYPTEEEPDFNDSLNIIRELEPEVVNVTRFSARPLTRAGRMPRLPSGVLKGRSRRLTDLRLSVARQKMERWIGWTGPALTVEAGHDGSTVGRLPNYLPVVLPERVPLGREFDVTVHGARSTYLLAQRLSGEGSRLRVGA